MSRSRRRRRIRGAVAIAMIAIAAVLWRWQGPALRSQLGIEGDPIPAKGDSFRVVTWNLRNLGRESHDLERLTKHLLELDADLYAFQEIVDPELVQNLLPTFQVATSKGGGRGHQHLVLAWNPERTELVGSSLEDSHISLGGRVRPAFTGYFRGQGGPDLYVTVVHLKAKPDGIDERRAQWPRLATWVTELRDDDDVLVVGDFNATGAKDDPERELAELQHALAGAELRRIPGEEPCSAYWDGERRDAWKEPSLLDLVWARGLHESLPEGSDSRVGTQCRRFACAPIRSTEAYPDPDLETVSDHCPVVLDLIRADDDGNLTPSQ